MAWLSALGNFAQKLPNFGQFFLGILGILGSFWAVFGHLFLNILGI